MRPTIKEFERIFEDYVENVVKKETPEESRQKLIKMGIMDEDGKLIVRHGIEWW